MFISCYSCYSHTIKNGQVLLILTDYANKNGDKTELPLIDVVKFLKNKREELYENCVIGIITYITSGKTLETCENGISDLKSLADIVCDVRYISEIFQRSMSKIQAIKQNHIWILAKCVFDKNAIFDSVSVNNKKLYKRSSETDPNINLRKYVICISLNARWTYIKFDFKNKIRDYYSRDTFNIEEYINFIKRAVKCYNQCDIEDIKNIEERYAEIIRIITERAYTYRYPFEELTIDSEMREIQDIYESLCEISKRLLNLE